MGRRAARSVSAASVSGVSRVFQTFRRVKGMVVTFNVTGGERGQWAVLQVSGELDLVTSPVLRQRVHDAVAEGRHSLVLDLSEVLFCDSSGVGVLIASRRLIRSARAGCAEIRPPRAPWTARTSTASSARWACAGSSTATRPRLGDRGQAAPPVRE
ncbi:hypothetical protein STENM327S_02665 [Streptomyces tendae]